MLCWESARETTLEQLKTKYGSVLNSMNQLGVHLTHVHIQDNKLYVEGLTGVTR